jgi:hypothetical protein
MLNTDSLAAVAASRFGERFMRPLYESYCFARIPATVRALLTGEAGTTLPAAALGPLAQQPPDAVILLFIDAFGWRFFHERAERYPFLKRILDDGVVSQLSTQFPSTTSAHVTTIHTGLEVGASGVFEWNYYEPALDAMISPLLFSFCGDRERDTLRPTGVDPARIYPASPFYRGLREAGVQPFVFQHHSYAGSPYTRVVAADAQVVSYRTLPEALTLLADLRAAQRGKAYYNLYFDGVDSVCHLHGPASRHVDAEIDALLSTLERTLHPALSGIGGRTLLLVAADHGHAAIDPATTLYLNRALPDVARFFRTSASGAPLVPGGSSRDMFLYIRPELLDEAEAELTALLAGRAEVHRVERLLAEGFFGTSPPSPALLGRIGNLVILPYAGESVWWYERGRFEQRYRGAHGGLTRDEAETILLAYAY